MREKEKKTDRDSGGAYRGGEGVEGEGRKEETGREGKERFYDQRVDKQCIELSVADNNVLSPQQLFHGRSRQRRYYLTIFLLFPLIYIHHPAHLM